MLHSVNFVFLSAGYICIPVNILELFFQDKVKLLGNNLIFWSMFYALLETQRCFSVS